MTEQRYTAGAAETKPTAYAFVDETGLHFQGLKPASEWSGIPYQVLRNAAACLCTGIPVREEVAALLREEFPELCSPRRFAPAAAGARAMAAMA